MSFIGGETLSVASLETAKNEERSGHLLKAKTSGFRQRTIHLDTILLLLLLVVGHH